MSNKIGEIFLLSGVVDLTGYMLEKDQKVSNILQQYQ
jgi:hypothetical protein